ncbi:flagellar biosynthesis anti-sigma factor FlgM [Roseateles saccharophilus]|uniref:Negative regulator of flagellin synthesis n=1 Tax=Roseateles saccharophilus TaxID=304 RepID=A0A4R3V668_ROSSA|nr:flagellar biosynthesis anti-sigma factor FlgM [Roseateles saccharophilus]MDG0834667.1 flagellar biosynthesis anti-sigma factor FlgM [Roseateles saccharophilus]TCU98903.1 FlgM family anti-sigma-28 factor [Roseateles saccharophilus]
MKIGHSHDASASPPKAERSATRKTEAAATAATETAQQTAKAGAPAPSAQVAISSAAKLAASGGSDDGSFDAAKVQRISQAISEGKFTVNANAIADKLVANAQELLSARANKH